MLLNSKQVKLVINSPTHKSMDRMMEEREREREGAKNKR
jgi:hypothetical protein